MHGLPPSAYGRQDLEQWPSYGDSSNQDSRWLSGTDDSDEDDNSPDPTHRCVHCDTGSYIKSERHRNIPYFCDECESVTRHQKV